LSVTKKKKIEIIEIDITTKCCLHIYNFNLVATITSNYFTFQETIEIILSYNNTKSFFYEMYCVLYHTS
jgi:hypothetical protein